MEETFYNVTDTAITFRRFNMGSRQLLGFYNTPAGGSNYTAICRCRETSV